MVECSFLLGSYHPVVAVVAVVVVAVVAVAVVVVELGRGAILDLALGHCLVGKDMCLWC